MWKVIDLRSFLTHQKVFLTSETTSCRRVHIFPTSSLATGVLPPVPVVFSTPAMQTRRWDRQQPICCLWNEFLYKTCQRKRDAASLKKKKAETSTWGFYFWVCVPLQWHRNEVTAMNTCIEELGHIMWIMLRVKFAPGHIFPLPFPKRQVGIPITRAVRWDTGVIRRGSPLARENDHSEFQKCIRVNRKGTK